ncbi:SidA/IucD/PvdA family monooxygenase [Xanthomonas campestris]|uniref:SidA/IucD/PvdA family monooxygenase n=1 Tax=Xanthomonas campestris TaxID=339 RepID=UPI001E3824DA|nr:SidA/IucD/PvdA family monooxygenase [Xanthomonas campestris]MCC5062968.1 FAD/NAD(P)-binding protein [Xanthomonas campestris pv. raphani]MEA9888186.1 SidA/IucD/PvdA family monooxygenase [Xanthomonas campestris pv. raphani]
MDSKKIAVIGGGPKAAALAAKVYCLREVYGVPLELVIFEPVSIGAAWSGACGYTDGKQRICTPPEKDVGFPYSVDAFGQPINEMMYRDFSWPMYLLVNQKYAEWVDRGRQRPRHSEFSSYLKYCIDKSEALVYQARVTHLVPKGRKNNLRWSIKALQTQASGDEFEVGEFDGVVVTGPGPVASKFAKVSDPRVLDGVNFWSQLSAVEGIIRDSDEPIIILGSGGTAAAIAGWMAAKEMDNEILIMGTQSSLFARIENSFENSAFTDQKQWAALSVEERKKFTERLTRGAVWSTVINILSDAKNVSYISGRATKVSLVDSENVASDLLVRFTTSAGGTYSKPACLVIDSTGFDAMWFASLLPDRWKKFLRKNSQNMQDGMLPSLELPVGALPRLHAPMLSHVVSPAFTSLMSLGGMSDAILRRYIEL